MALGLAHENFLGPGDNWTYFYVANTNSNIIKTIVNYGHTDAGRKHLLKYKNTAVYDYVAKPFFIMTLTVLNLIKANPNWAIYFNLIIGLFFILFSYNFLEFVFKEEKLAFIGTLILILSVQFNLYVNSGLANISAIFLFFTATYAFFIYNKIGKSGYFYLSFVLYSCSILFHPSELFFGGIALLFIFIYSIQKRILKKFILGAVYFSGVIILANLIYYVFKIVGGNYYYNVLFHKNLSIPILQMAQHYTDTTVLDKTSPLRNFLTYAGKLLLLEGVFYFIFVFIGFAYSLIKLKEQQIEVKFLVFVVTITYFYYIIISPLTPVNRNISQLISFFPFFFIIGYKLLAKLKVLRFIIIFATIFTFIYLNSSYFVRSNEVVKLANYLKNRHINELYVNKFYSGAVGVTLYGIKVNILDSKLNSVKKGDYVLTKLSLDKTDKIMTTADFQQIKVFKYLLIRDIIRQKYLTLFRHVCGNSAWIIKQQKGITARSRYVLYKKVAL